MEGYAIVRHGEPLEHITLPTPVPTGREVLVAVTHAGVCHSDLHLIEGGYDLGSRGMLDLAKRGLKLPMIPGHEIVGRVVSWGPDADASDLKVGDVRLVFPWVGCGICVRCRQDEQNLCLTTKPIGMATNGGYATHVVVPEAKFLLDIEGLDPALASTYACSGVTVYGAIRKLMPLVADEMVVVIGSGGLGLNAVAILPPGTTSTVAWTQNGPLLAAAAQTISGTTTYEILEYANSGSAWTEKVFGTSPSYAD